MAPTNPSPKQTQMEINPEDRPRYTQDQQQAYFKCINLPHKYLDSPVLGDSSLAQTKEHGLPLLQALMLHHLANIPFEDLELHYSAHKTISLDMNDLYTKFVMNSPQYGRGGRCMENNGFFGTLLRSMGYDVRNCGGRVSRMTDPDPEVRRTQGNTYCGWTHMFNLVRLDRQWYVVDVGMGAWGPNIAYPLEDGYEIESIAPRRIRLQKRSIAEHAAATEEDAQKLWCYDVCIKPGAEEGDTWMPLYCFAETEFLPQDYELISWFTSTSPKSFFTYSVLCTKMLLDEAGEKIVGDVTLFGSTVRKTANGKREVLKECKSEQERIDALEEIFNVHLRPEEKDGIPDGMRI